MGVLTTLAIIVVIVGIALAILGVLPATSARVPNGLAAGISLIVVGLVVYLLVVLLAGGTIT